MQITSNDISNESAYINYECFYFRKINENKIQRYGNCVYALRLQRKR